MAAILSSETTIHAKNEAVYEQWQVQDNHGPGTGRRMINQEWMRRVDDRMLTAFDFPDCGQVMSKRPVSTTPLQALNLMNCPFVVERSQFVAARALEGRNDSRALSEKDCSSDKDKAIYCAFELLLVRPPTDNELEACRSVSPELFCRGLIHSNEFAFLP